MENIQADIDAIGSIEAITSIIEVVCRTTGMGFLGVARVTDDKWITCAVRDEIVLDLFPATVTNAGKPTPEAVREKLFRPFSRGSRVRTGLNLAFISLQKSHAPMVVRYG
ncbi:signal transduction histidine kinase [Mucilaginibacter sp. UYNi724]